MNGEAKCVSLLVSCEMEEWINGWTAYVRDYLHGVLNSSNMYSNKSLTAIMLSPVQFSTQGHDSKPTITIIRIIQEKKIPA